MMGFAMYLVWWQSTSLLAAELANVYVPECLEPSKSYESANRTDDVADARATPGWKFSFAANKREASGRGHDVWAGKLVA